MPSVLLSLSAPYIVRQRHPLEARIQASLPNLASVGWCGQPARHRDPPSPPVFAGFIGGPRLTSIYMAAGDLKPSLTATIRGFTH